MQSPFQIFRKHQKILMVVLVGLAMVSFVLLGSVSSMHALPPQLFIVLIAILLGGAFAIFGMQGGKGKQVEFGLTGAVIGAAIGFAFMWMSRPTAVVETTAGKLSEKDMRELGDRRRIALRFMSDAVNATVPMPEMPTPDQMDPRERQLFELIQRNPQLARNPRFLELLPSIKRYNAAVRQWQRLHFEASFPLQANPTGREGVSERDVVLKYLLLKEAKDLGIQVNNDAVERFINRVTDKKMNSKIFVSIARDLHVDKSKIYDVLREEIACQVVLNLERPDRLRIVPPAAYWERYRKLNVRQNLEFTPVPVSAFVSQVPEPGNDKLRAFFDKYKDKAPTGVPSPDPAFGYPERVQIAYFKADYTKVEADVLEKIKDDYLSEKEIKKELKRIDEAVADVQKKIKSGDIPKELAKRELTDARQKHLRELLTAGRKINRFDFEIVREYEANKSWKYQNPNWKKPFPEGKAKPDPFRKSSTSNEEPVEAPKPRKKAAPQVPKPKTRTKKTGAVRSPSGVSVARLAAARYSPVLFTSALQPEGKSAAKKPAASGKSGNAKTSSAVTAPKPKSAGKTSTAKKSFRLSPVLPPPPSLPENPTLPFRKFDETLRSSIRDELLRGKVLQEIRNRMKQAAVAMEPFRLKYLEYLEDSERPFDPKAISNALRQKAKRIGLQYVVTGLFGELEFRESPEKYPMSGTWEVSEFEGDYLKPLSRALFPAAGGGDRETANNQYRVIRAQSRGGADEDFVLWATAHEKARAPKFNEPGVRDRVLKAWKQVQARSLAEKRARSLMKLVASQKRSMDDVLKEKTVTGASAGVLLRPERTRTPFTWLTMTNNSTAPQRQIQMPTQIIPTPISGVEKAGEGFRAYIFETLKDGELGVVPNADKSVYYVVRVLEREPTTDDGWKAHMRDLVDSNFGATGYAELNAPDNRENETLINKTMERLYNKYNVRWNRQPDKQGRG